MGGGSAFWANTLRGLNNHARPDEHFVGEDYAKLKRAPFFVARHARVCGNLTLVQRPLGRSLYTVGQTGTG